MARVKTLTAQETHPDATSTEVVAGTSLYWFGMLPAKGTFKIKKHTRDKQTGTTNDYFTWQDVTSQELWEGDNNQWVGRCPWKQSLAMNGMSFDAYTETLMRPVGAAAGSLDRHSWPGAVGEWDDEKFQKIIAQCYRNMMRMENGKGWEKSIDQNESYMMLDNGTEKVTKLKFNPKTDTWFAHYVYVIKLDANPQEHDASTYYRLAMPWHEFFRSPPLSVAEAFPLKKEEAGKIPAA